MALTADQFLEKIGSFERYQWLILGIFGYILIIAYAFPVLIVTFITAEPDWICIKGSNNSICNFTEPVGLTSDDYQARCDMPREVWAYVDEFTSTVTEYDLVCDNSYLLVVVQSSSWVGMFVGLIIGGYIGDRMGRKIIYYIPLAVIVLATWVMVYPKHFAVFIVGRTFVGMASGLLGISSFILLTEYTSVAHRAKMGISSFHFFVTAMPILALMGYLLPHWRDFLLASAIMATPALCLWRFIPESIRWLLLNDKYDEAVKQLAKVAKMNKKEMPNEEIRKPIVEQRGNFRHLFYNRETTKRTLINLDVWMSISLVYYGVTYGSVDLGWNRYLAFALTSLIEHPSNFAAIWSSERFGRKKGTVFGLIFACISSIIAVMIPYEQTRQATVSTIFRIIMAVIAKFFITVSFNVICVWTVELFPTYIRSIAASSVKFAGIVGSILATYVIWLIRIHPMLPFGIMAFICFQSSFVTMFLPETKGQATMETMMDLEQQMLRSRHGSNDEEKHENKTVELATVT